MVDRCYLFIANFVDFERDGMPVGRKTLDEIHRQRSHDRGSSSMQKSPVQLNIRLLKAYLTVKIIIIIK